jgi:hypothetical protein
MLNAPTSKFRILCNSGLFPQYFAFSNIFFSFCLSVAASAADATFLGHNACASSGCHSGAGANQNQNIVWSRHDPHSRSPATLTTARSATLARLLGIKDATQDRRCTSCHAPWQGVAAALVPADLKPSLEAISCETCHGPSSEWLRSHTRPDLNRAQKALDGLADLTILYNRANACVACHQVITPELLQAGHPELMFELDGQTAAMPRHWRERDPDVRPKAWLAGQASALRELTAQLLQQKTSNAVSARTFDQWQSLLWMASKTDATLADISTNAASSTNDLRHLHELADKLSLRASSTPLGSNFVSKILLALAKTGGDFPAGKTNSTNSTALCSRAERLVLALDRLTLSAPPQTRARVDNDLNLLFQSVQNRQTFNAPGFSERLRSFETNLSRGP